MAKQELKFRVTADNRKAIQQFGKFKRVATSSVAGIAGAFGAAMSVGSIIAFGKKIVDLGDDIGKMAKRFGVSTDFIQKFRLMTELSGASMEALQKGLKSQSRALLNAERGLITYTRPFEELNLEYKELMKMQPEDSFQEIAKALGKVENRTKRAGLAQEIFGRSATGLLPLINDYQQVAQQAADAVIFSPEDIKSAEAFKDSMTQLEKSLMGIAVGTGFLPWLSDVADRLEKAVGLSKQIKQAQSEGTTGNLVSGTSQAVNIGRAAMRYINPIEALAQSLGSGQLGEQVSVKAADYTKVEVGDRTTEQIKTAIKEAMVNKRY